MDRPVSKLGRPPSLCTACVRTKQLEIWRRKRELYRARHPERVKEQKHKHYLQNKEKYREYNRKYHQDRKNAEYAVLLDKQHGVCAICGQVETKQNENGRFALSYDHDHDNGKYRGLLCQRCNLLLGHGNDDPELLRKAARYIEEWRIYHSQLGEST